MIIGLKSRVRQSKVRRTTEGSVDTQMLVKRLTFAAPASVPSAFPARAGLMPALAALALSLFAFAGPIEAQVQLPAIPMFQAAASHPVSHLKVITRDESDAPVAGVSVEVRPMATPVGVGVALAKSLTSQNGEVDLTIPAGNYRVSVSKEGFQTLTQNDVKVDATAPLDVQYTMAPKIEVKQEVNVQGTADSAVEQGSSPATELGRQQIKALPARPATVADALPVVPGVVRTPDGQIEISGAAENRSAFLVNSVDSTDPATGQFGLTVPVDSVESLSVFKNPYLAKYGRFTAGVVAVETRRGGEKWHFELNDPMPEFRIRSLHLRGLKEFSPHVVVSGPIIANRFYNSTSVQYNLEKRAVRTLPFPFNETKLHSVNFFTQMDYFLSATHTLTGTFHGAPQTTRFVGLDFFNPQPVTPDFNSGDYTGTIIDRLEVKGGLLRSTISEKQFDGTVSAQGRDAMILTPTGNRGNYFSSQTRDSSRLEWLETFALAPISARGAHHLEFGSSLVRSSNRGSFEARNIDLLDPNRHLLRQIKFVNGRPYDRQDFDGGFFGQDHWQLVPQLSVDMGLRLEHQAVTHALRMAPRVGFALAPFSGLQTVVRGGIGIFYDNVPLNVYAFNSYPERIVTTYNPSGGIIDGPRRFFNITEEQAQKKFPFIRRRRHTGNFAPYSVAWNVEVEHPINRLLKLRANYLHSSSHDLITLNPRVVRERDALVLSGDGDARYRQLELTASLAWKQGRQFYFSYVRSHAQADLNGLDTYLGNFPVPVVRRNQFANAAGDLPNRFIAWGEYSLPWKMRLAPMVELRNGFPYAVTNVFQDYVGVANSDKTRFPAFFSADAQLSKDMAVSSKYTLRMSGSVFNLTNHFNGLAVHSNTADPQFGNIFGNYNRRFRVDFDVLF